MNLSSTHLFNNLTLLNDIKGLTTSIKVNSVRRNYCGLALISTKHGFCNCRMSNKSSHNACNIYIVMYNLAVCLI